MKFPKSNAKTTLKTRPSTILIGSSPWNGRESKKQGNNQTYNDEIHIYADNISIILFRINHIIFSSLARISTISDNFLTDSKTLSSKTVVNSCSISVNSTVMFNESNFRSDRRSLLKLKALSSTSSLSYILLRILVSI